MQAGKQTSLLSFFNKTPTPKRPAGVAAKTPLGPAGEGQTVDRFPPGTLLWSKLPGYPWWPSLVCSHPTTASHTRKGEIHVMFLDTPVNRSWVPITMVKRWGEKVAADNLDKHPNLVQGKKDADKVAHLSNEERLKILLVELQPSDGEGSEEEEESPGNKENKDSTSVRGGSKKRRRIIMDDSEDDSGDEFKPSKKDLEEEDESDVSEGEAENMEEEAESEPESSPDTKSRKRKMKAAPVKGKKARPRSPGPVSTPGRKFGLGTPGPAASPAAAVSDNTKRKLAAFGAGPAGRETAQQFSHNSLEFLRPDRIRDREKRLSDHPEFNPRTLHVPENFLSSQTPAQRQWWVLKSQYYDVVLFFKMGKFYELFHMDADIGVSVLNLVYMRGETAHAGFPEVAYSRYATTLVEKGYKVARIEQTETPLMMEERVKNSKRKTTKFDKVVEREVCQVQSKGTRVNSFLDSFNYEGEPSYLLALIEKPGQVFGVAFIDTTIGCFHIGQFSDDKQLSRLRTLGARYPPSEVLLPRGNLAPSTLTFLNSSLAGVRQEVLRPGTEFWDSSKTLRVLTESDGYFKTDGETQLPDTLKTFLDASDCLGLTASAEGELAVSALGALVFYLTQHLLDQQLLSQRKFQRFSPREAGAEVEAGAEAGGPVGKHLVLDGITVRNLELLANSAGGRAGSLLGRLDSCRTAMGRRNLRQWILAPLLQLSAITVRQTAVTDLMGFHNTQQVQLILKKLPDLERLLSKIHAAGDSVKSKTHPDSRAIFFEGAKYSKRKIMDLLSCLDGFKLCVRGQDGGRALLEYFEDEKFESSMLRSIVTTESQGGAFPDLQELLTYFDGAFDQKAAKKDGKIIPSEGVDPELDAANESIAAIAGEMQDYLKGQKRHFGCEVKYWGTGKNRFQLEIPASKVNKASDEYELASGTKNVKRYVTEETKSFLERQVAAEDRRDKALMDIQRKIFALFSSHADTWRRAIDCVSLLDSLLSLACYSAGLEDGCFPTFTTESNVLDIKEAKHPCLDNIGISYIANDTFIGEESKLIVLTGPNMGGKSTLMRQTGLLVVLAQLGCKVPAQSMLLSPVDRVFTRLGAEDNIIGGESTFFVELQETGAILQHATRHSLVLIDELGRGTATYDGTAIAGAVVDWLVCRAPLTLFATHYHAIAAEQRPGMRSAHMACMVENEGHADITQEDITFLYKLTEGAAPKSHGFNAAKLAGLPVEIIRSGHAKAKQFEKQEKKRKLIQNIFAKEFDINQFKKDIVSF